MELPLIGTYFGLLPIDLRKLVMMKTPIFLPYPDVLERDKGILTHNFWLVKAASEIGVPLTQEFIGFFNGGPVNHSNPTYEISRYIRVLAYSGVVVPGRISRGPDGTNYLTADGSNSIVDAAEICRHALTNERLREYFFFILTQHLLSETSNRYIIEVACNHGDIDLLLTIFGALKKREIPRELHHYNNLLYSGASAEKLQELWNAIPNNSSGEGNNFIGEYLDEHMSKLIKIRQVINQENYDELKSIDPYISMTLGIVEYRETLIKCLESLSYYDTGLMSTHKLIGYIATENLEKIWQTMRTLTSMAQIPHEAIVRKDSITIYELIYNGVPKKHRFYFAGKVKALAFYKSKLFTYIKDYSESVVMSPVSLIRRSCLDFAGLAIIYKSSKGRISPPQGEKNSTVWNEIINTFPDIHEEDRIILCMSK